MFNVRNLHCDTCSAFLHHCERQMFAQVLLLLSYTNKPLSKAANLFSLEKTYRHSAKHLLVKVVKNLGSIWLGAFVGFLVTVMLLLLFSWSWSLGRRFHRRLSGWTRCSRRWQRINCWFSRRAYLVPS